MDGRVKSRLRSLSQNLVICDLHHCLHTVILVTCAFSASYGSFLFRPMIPAVGAFISLKRRRNHGGNCSSEAC